MNFANYGVSYFYILSEKLIQILLKTMKGEGVPQKIEGSCETWKILLDLFETWIVNEDCRVSEEVQKLLKEVIQTSLDEKSWKLFIFKCVKNHL